VSTERLAEHGHAWPFPDECEHLSRRPGLVLAVGRRTRRPLRRTSFARNPHRPGCHETEDCSALSRLKHRQAVLADQRNLKMTRSAHAYVRGNTLKFRQCRAVDPAGRAADMDLRRPPSRQSRAGRRCGRPHRHPDPRSRPDRDRQSGARCDPPRPVTSDGGARLRALRGDNGAHARADDRGLRDRLPRRRASIRGGAHRPVLKKAAKGAPAHARGNSSQVR
jgi:hypothetical protein